MTRTVGIIARTDRKESIDLASKVVDDLEDRGIKVFLEPSLATNLGQTEKSMTIRKMKTDLVVTIGGDGTILRTCLRLPKPEPPILAIDMGARGFLTEVQPNEAMEAIENYLGGRYFIERYGKLASFIGRARLPDALNEVFITSRHLAKLLYVRIWRDDLMVMDCRADGIIISSRVGSTAYAFSAGGPVLDPSLDAFVLTPVCPATLARPFVFPSDLEVRIELIKPETAMLVIDGDYQKRINGRGSSILVKKSEWESSFIRFRGDFYKRLNTRLLFSREEGYESEKEK
ncbi:MAG: NAD(+)/NADH kinase [Nitrososphaerota archaeon]|nr:NAD(+)/NADH kinase [Candidatus Bathyarchaeota archaeon]MDW8048514.1 NAD(+)/NADH kinase [Nitrososphaerota archaeon]